MKNQPVLGFIFAFIAAIMWGTLPIAIQQVLPVMNAQTIVWYRFLIAAIGLFCLLSLQHKLWQMPTFHRRDYWFLCLCIIGLSGNFLLFNIALKYIPATTSQVLSPLSSFIMIGAGVLLFKEQMGKHQKIGLGILLIGLVAFFNDRWSDFLQLNRYFIGVIIACCASAIWTLYGIGQKLLLRKFTSQQILFLIYTSCAVLFTPFAEITQFQALNRFQLANLAFCCANTLIAYGCYAEAINRWEIAKVSAIMPQIPILTIIFSEILMYISPAHFNIAHLNLLSYFGALMVVIGAMFSAVGQHLLTRKRK